MVEVYDHERVDYLLAEENMRIIQSAGVFAFSLDAVLLANFTYVPIKQGEIMDLCTGNGVIPLLLSKRSFANMTGVEIQERLFDMAKRNVKLNHLEDQINMIHGDLKDMAKLLGHGKFDLVTCNPPYFNTPHKREQNENDYFTIARHEICCTLDDVIAASSKLVRSGGKISIVHRPNRLVELITLFKKYQVEPKRLRFVYPRQGKEANTILIEGIKDGKSDMKILPPLYCYDENGVYTKELEEIVYGRK
ncbi:tRNA1(Val) (adenine(37)-N6)-methyltransferase [Aquibacillus sp. 3ASR75-11]|uniref:tRNA1(Val) (Adenine(37)-N6)-methyltransferase n=1 Tax=Terrihalobacillus insolitus TaxID=2950438 RepID=A0A9X3WWW9_9BACI|nr:tRNA1(Val) (adenine(37)-N6)-methyltransferase [Terrihalobacillus insolitus]MDC3414884.1 tRNA1(Val) (adenine(37)-N6)-methyltransferase [Terrihalobacillus insolitus]MDC3426033.1 tRNA1(Val) (adenine(37)-N6)-methyltransferase [Terrihalobacillus insolitus]